MEAAQPQLADPLHHPVEVIQANSRKVEEQQLLQRQAMLLGRGYALRTALAHKAIAETANWSVGSRVSRVMRDQYDDTHTRIDFEDVFGRPQDDPNPQPTARNRMLKAVFGSDMTVKPIA